MAKKREVEAEKETSERWLLTYADMITLLLALFVVLYAISAVDAQKYEEIKSAMQGAFEGGGGGGGGGASVGLDGLPDLPIEIVSPPGTAEDRFSELYQKLLAEVRARGYADHIAVLFGDGAIVVRFRDSVLFYPDQSVIRPEGLTVLENISATLVGMGSAIGHIQIEGHTAFIGEEYERSYLAWDLSADRAIAVLRYLDEQGGIEQRLMNIAGYSHFVPLADNDTEEGRAQNRRVELRISPPKTEGGLRG